MTVLCVLESHSQLIFVYAFAIGSTLVMMGSALIGPGQMLPVKADAPSAIHALCKSPLHAGLAQAMKQRLGGKLAFVGIHMSWNYLLEPPTDLCGDIIISESEAFRRARKRSEDDFVHGCQIGCRLPSFEAYIDEAKLVAPLGT